MRQLIHNLIAISICVLYAEQLVWSQNANDSLLTIQGKIIDGESEEAVAFAVIVQQGTNNGGFSDIDGNFSIQVSTSNAPVLFRAVGYRPIELNYAMINGTIRLYPDQVSLNEVVIRPGINPAERIIRAAIANKAINHPEKAGAFTYESYNRLAFGAQLDSNLVHHPDSLALKDTSTQKMYDFFDKQYLFLLETVSQRKFLPPNHSEETIIANRVSGLKNADFFALATQLQSFSFYDEEVNLMSSRYMSPLADNSISKYLFILENTTVLQKDTVWTISYRPRKNKNFDGMEGVLYINSNRYALQQVTATPKVSSQQSIRIQQQYQFIDQRRWFPVQLNSTLTFGGMQVNNVPMVGDGKSYIKNIQLDPPLKVSEFSPVILKMDKNAAMANDSIWSIHRGTPLSAKDSLTYQVIDSVGQEMNLDKKMKVMESLIQGKWRLGPIDLDLNRLMAFNNFEGFRGGVGIHTNDALMKRLSIGGYYAYGFRDKGHKYGGDAIVHLNKKRGIELKAAYSNDVQETGGNQLEKIETGLIKSIYPLFVNRMDRRETTELSLRGRWWSNLSGIAGVTHQYIDAYSNYQWYQAASDALTIVQRQFELLEGNLTLRYAPGEKLIRLGNREVAVGGKWPVCIVRLAKSFSAADLGGLEYERVDLNLSKVFYILNVGELTMQMYAGKITGDRPAPLLYNARGTYDRFTIAVPNTFETMHTNEFMHDEFVALHVRHNFKHLLFRRPNFEPQLVVSYSGLFGKLTQPNDHSIALDAATLGFHETGLSINNLFKSSFSSLGFGTFYRFGPYHLSTIRENIAFKLTSTFVF